MGWWRKTSTPRIARSRLRLASAHSRLRGGGQIALHRVRVVKSVIQAQLNPYVGSIQITLIGQDRWLNYPVWRQKTWREKVEREIEERKKQEEKPKERPLRVSDASI